MKLIQIFSVYDSKAEAYLQPFFAPSKGVALRMFSDAANDQNHEFSKHAADYTLFQIGEFNESTGEILAHPRNKVSLGNALEYKSAGERRALQALEAAKQNLNDNKEEQ